MDIGTGNIVQLRRPRLRDMQFLHSSGSHQLDTPPRPFAVCDIDTPDYVIGWGYAWSDQVSVTWTLPATGEPALNRNMFVSTIDAIEYARRQGHPCHIVWRGAEDFPHA